MGPNKFGRLSFYVPGELLIMLTLHTHSEIVFLQAFGYEQLYANKMFSFKAGTVFFSFLFLQQAHCSCNVHRASYMFIALNH